MDYDPAALTSGVQAAKLGFDTIRSLFGVLKDAKDAMPKGAKSDAVGLAIEQSEKHFAIAEAQIAKGLGYQLCKCEFPPTIMLTVGNTYARGIPQGPVYECPKCQFNTAAPYDFNRTREV